MHDLRYSTALRQLADLGHEPDPSRWSWAIVALERSGRLLLPADARQVLGARPAESVEVVGVYQRNVLVVRPQGVGRRLTVDRRGRFCVPVWMRRRSASSLLVGVRSGDRTVVLAAPAILDSIGDVLVGAGR